MGLYKYRALFRPTTQRWYIQERITILWWWHLWVGYTEFDAEFDSPGIVSFTDEDSALSKIRALQAMHDRRHAKARLLYPSGCYVEKP